MRDAMLAVSGQLDRKPQGLGRRPFGDGYSDGVHAAGVVRRPGAPSVRFTCPWSGPTSSSRWHSSTSPTRPGLAQRATTHGTRSGAVPAEQSVRDAPGRDGRRPAPVGGRRRLRLPADPRGLPARLQSAANGGGETAAEAVPRLLRTRHRPPRGAPGGSHRSSSRLGGHSTRPCSPARISSIEVDRGPSCRT